MIDSEDRKFEFSDIVVTMNTIVVTMNTIVDEAFRGEKVTCFTDGILPGSTRNDKEVRGF